MTGDYELLSAIAERFQWTSLEGGWTKTIFDGGDRLEYRIDATSENTGRVRLATINGGWFTLSSNAGLAELIHLLVSVER